MQGARMVSDRAARAVAIRTYLPLPALVVKM